jgi:hypothetical protein
MNKELNFKIVGLTLLLSTGILVVIKISSIPDAYYQMDAWLQSDEGSNDVLFMLSGVLAFEILLLASRFVLGYCLFCKKTLNNWQFYTLAILVGVSGFYFTGIILSLAAIVLRHYQVRYEAKT